MSSLIYKTCYIKQNLLQYQWQSFCHVFCQIVFISRLQKHSTGICKPSILNKSTFNKYMTIYEAKKCAQQKIFLVIICYTINLFFQAYCVAFVIPKPFCTRFIQNLILPTKCPANNDYIKLGSIDKKSFQVSKLCILLQSHQYSCTKKLKKTLCSLFSRRRTCKHKWTSKTYPKGIQSHYQSYKPC